MKFIYLGITNYFTDGFYLWLMLARRLCVYNVGLKVDASQELLSVVMTSYYENFHSCKRHTIVRRTFLFLAIRFALSWPHDSQM